MFRNDGRRFWPPAIFIYDRVGMFRSLFPVCVGIVMLIMPGMGIAQSSHPTADFSSTARSAVGLAESGHCGEALPSLRKSVDHIKEPELRRKVALNGVRCAMTLRQTDVSLKFLRLLTSEFPADPEALYVAVHAYSDLSTLASQELARSAPESVQAHELLAEAFEAQRKWDEAEKEYRAILKQDPNLPGIHFRLGRLLLSRPNPPASTADEAKQEFAAELLINPNNAGAEYVLGELARQRQEWQEAASHFSRAAKLDPKFGEAFLGLGMALIGAKSYPDAIAPLETAVKLEPRNPDAHYNLALAYSRSGRKQDGDKEFAVHQRLIGEQGGNAPQGSSADKPQ
jgi:tetratricopeptide (TPR) repeat protein